ncbi:MAG TPA: ATP-binding SpoIIE family protein phosphatase [Terriglobales bacterium]|nr:ATP-binding SpoIIE family protein phosphatase [Terriglobales bacterium]
MNLVSFRLPVVDPSQTGEARRTAINAAANLNFSSTQQGKVGIVASELATNLAKHSHGGEFLVQEIRCADRVGLELMTVDAGPGIGDIGKVMRDGFSTAGSQGTGLGAVRRLANSFDIYSQNGNGSVFVAQIWANESQGALSGIEYGVVSVPHPGEKSNGDGWYLDDLCRGRYAVLIVDGLGHGQYAFEAANAAVEAYKKTRDKEPEQIVQYAHGALRSTRGAAMALAVVDGGKQLVHYVGIGNIVAGIVSESGIRRMISHDGTVGHAVRKVQAFTYPWSKDALLIMHSDGLTANWNLERYPGLLARSPSVIAGVLYRDCRRKNDDATVLVAREK